MKIKLISTNRYLWQKIRLLCQGDEVDMASAPTGDFDRLIWDADSMGEGAPPHAIIYSRTGAGELGGAFCDEELICALGRSRGERLSVDEGAHTAILDGRVIRLTEVEFSLLFELYSRRGRYIPRAELIERVWGDIGNDRLINVYIHYLREKLETGAERFIFCSRKEGYKLDVSEKEEVI